MEHINSFPEDFYHHLTVNSLTGIKAGSDRTTFLDIWMVNVDGRIFARSWGKSERSWYTTLLQGHSGQIKYRENVIDIVGKKCTDPLINEQVNSAYLQRYTTPENRPYAIGITQPEYADYTMELLYSG